MIGRLTGVLDYRTADHILIDVRGVGYLVFCSERTMAGLPGVGEPVSLYTDLIVREDLLQLFGFSSLVEKEWHRLLMSVQGIGAKVSLAILGTLGPDAVSRAIALGDWATIKAAKGVGPKTAQRIVLDLKDKAPAVMAMGGTLVQAMDSVIEPITASVAPDVAAQADALSALGNLGYAVGDAAAAVAEVGTPDMGTSDLIRAALKVLAPKG